jgi:hypothetical protein
MVSVVKIEIGCEEFFEEPLFAQGARHLVQCRDLRLATDTSREITVYGKRRGSNLDLMDVDRQTMSMVTQSTTARATIRVGARKTHACNSVFSKNWLQVVESQCEPTIKLQGPAITRPERHSAEFTLNFDRVFDALEGFNGLEGDTLLAQLSHTVAGVVERCMYRRRSCSVRRGSKGRRGFRRFQEAGLFSLGALVIHPRSLPFVRSFAFR